MITDWINVNRVSIQGADRLYPKDLDWTIEPGINAVVGGTGLGKTTLVYALQFAIFGKMVVNGDERIEREFFKDRLTKRSGDKLQKNPPTVHVEFNAGGVAFLVERNLITGSLISVTCDGTVIKTNTYEDTLAEKVGLTGDFASLTKLQCQLFFFGEGRYLLAWANLIQNELLNLMMSDHATYVRLADLWAKAESADSEARNISAQAVRLEKDLKTLSPEESKVGELKRRSDGKQLTQNLKSIEETISTIRKKIAEEGKLELSQGEKIAKSHADFHHELNELETTQSSDLDNALLAAALASPTVASMRRALEEFYHSPDNRNCPCCGRTGIAPVISRLVENAASSAQAGNCVVCSKMLPQKNDGKSDASPVSNASKGTNSKAQALQTLLFQREQTRSRIAELHNDEAKALRELAEAREIEIKHLRESPVAAENVLLITVKQMRSRETKAKKIRDKHLASLKKELKKTNAVFDDIQTKIAKAFKKYATLYLDEPCDVKFLQEAELPGKRGPQIKAPHAAFFPVISGETRPSAQALSDAQRSFVDLAFRMAVLDVWHQITKKTVTMIIETPEGAVDIAYMERVATMIRTFGEQGHTLIITTNLNNAIFLPELMAAWPKANRADHILNLLEKGIPRPVQVQHKSHFNGILKAVSEHSVLK